jgi:hypothetical protein
VQKVDSDGGEKRSSQEDCYLNGDVSQPDILGPGFREPSGRYRVISLLLNQYGMSIFSWLIMSDRNFYD